jgi:hypothetical protein
MRLGKRQRAVNRGPGVTLLKLRNPPADGVIFSATLELLDRAKYRHGWPIPDAEAPTSAVLPSRITFITGRFVVISG